MAVLVTLTYCDSHRADSTLTESEARPDLPTQRTSSDLVVCANYLNRAVPDSMNAHSRGAVLFFLSLWKNVATWDFSLRRACHVSRHELASRNFGEEAHSPTFPPPIIVVTVAHRRKTREGGEWEAKAGLEPPQERTGADEEATPQQSFLHCMSAFRIRDILRRR